VAVRQGLPILAEEHEIIASQIERIGEDAVHTTLAAGEAEGLRAPR
jgi:hypothetical protein